jgi:hypothetical protein
MNKLQAVVQNGVTVLCPNERAAMFVLEVLKTGYRVKRWVRGKKCGAMLEDGRLVGAVSWREHPSTFKNIYTLKFR